MSNLSFSQRLGRIAHMNKYYHGHRAAFYAPMFSIHMGADILALAREVSGDESLLPSDVLSALFSSEAQQILRRLPNIYWFWVILEEACSKGVINNEEQAPDVAALQRAIEIQRSFVVRSFDLNRDHEQLNGLETACWVAHGVLLVVTRRKSQEPESPEPYRYSLIRNPIFYTS